MVAKAIGQLALCEGTYTAGKLDNTCISLFVHPCTH